MVFAQVTPKGQQGEVVLYRDDVRLLVPGGELDQKPLPGSVVLFSSRNMLGEHWGTIGRGLVCDKKGAEATLDLTDPRQDGFVLAVTQQAFGRRNAQPAFLRAMIDKRDLGTLGRMLEKACLAYIMTTVLDKERALRTMQSGRLPRNLTDVLLKPERHAGQLPAVAVAGQALEATDRLNPKQLEALGHILAGQGVTMVMGPPGTG
jgi:hypothetical protein